MKPFHKKQSAALADRIEKARRERRTQQALELARQLAKQEPGEAHAKLLRDVALERGCQLLSDGKPRDALTVFRNAREMGGPPEFEAALAGKIAEAGDAAGALAIFAQLPDSPERTRGFAIAVDSAVVTGASGRDLLPADLHPAFDAVIRAFAHVEKGEDDAARDALQPVGLASPLLEWRVLLRGLIAYHNRDDARALENWQRLDPNRQPARLAAPLRFHIDADYRAAQSPEAQTRLRRRIESLGADAVISQMRQLAKSLTKCWGHRRDTREAFRLAAQIVKELHAKMPAIEALLIKALQPILLKNAEPDDLDDYRVHLPAPADDPKLLRLMALITEQVPAPTFALNCWLNYERFVAERTDLFPGESNALARALIWSRMGDFAGFFAEELASHPDIPTPEACYRESLKRKPDRLASHLGLVNWLARDVGFVFETWLKAARDLVAQFPDHAHTWERIGKACATRNLRSEAIEAFRAGLKANPMSQSMRSRLARELWVEGWQLARQMIAPAKKPRTKKVATAAPPSASPEQYRALFQESLDLLGGVGPTQRAGWAITELRAGHNDAAEAQIALLDADAPNRVAAALALHHYAQAEKKLPADLRKRFSDRWTACLKSERTPSENVAAFGALASLESRTVSGIKKHAGQILPVKNDRELEPYSQADLVVIGEALRQADYLSQAKKVMEHATRRFPQAPEAALELARIYLAQSKASKASRPNYRIRWCVDTARRFADTLPLEKRTPLLEEIEKIEAELALTFENPFGVNDRMMKSILEAFGGIDPSEIFDDDDDDDEDDEYSDLF